MKVKKIDNTYVLRLEIGDEIIQSIKTLCKQEGITAGTVQGIGATDCIDIGYYSLESKKYHTVNFNEQFEIISLTGNISVKDNEPYLHLHGAFSRADYSVVAGHLNSAVISITAEIFVTSLNATLYRAVSAETGLNIFDIN